MSQPAASCHHCAARYVSAAKTTVSTTCACCRSRVPKSSPAHECTRYHESSLHVVLDHDMSSMCSAATSQAPRAAHGMTVFLRPQPRERDAPVAGAHRTRIIFILPPFKEMP